MFLLNLRPEFLIFLEFLLVFSFDNSNPIFQAIDDSAALVKLLVLGMEQEFVGILQFRYFMSIWSAFETSLFCECCRGMAKNVGICRLNEIVWLRSGSIFWVRDFSEVLLVVLFRPVSTFFDILCLVLFILMISFVFAMGIFLTDLLLAVNLLHSIQVWMGFGSVGDASFFLTVLLWYGFQDVGSDWMLVLLWEFALQVAVLLFDVLHIHWDLITTYKKLRQWLSSK